VIEADLADPATPARLVEQAGTVDVLVANAALPASGRILDLDTDQIDRCLQVNLHAPINLARLLMAGMLERKGGHVVFIGSLAGIAPTAGGSIYSATKFGLRGFALAARQDLHGTGVGVSIVSPGFIRDAGMFADSRAELPRGTRTSRPGQVADAVVTAVTRDRAEVVVAPTELALGARLFGLVPAVGEALSRLAGGAAVADAMAEGQRDKR
jgi:short-subunit dehydrogenase